MTRFIESSLFTCLYQMVSSSIIFQYSYIGSFIQFECLSSLVNLVGFESKPFHTRLVFVNELLALSTLFAVEQKTFIPVFLFIETYATWLGFVDSFWFTCGVGLGHFKWCEVKR